VIKKATTIKNYSIEFLSEQTLCNYLTDLFRGGAIDSSFSCPHERTLGRRCGYQCAASVIVDNLRINVFPGEMDCQPRPFRRTSDFLPDPLMNALPRCLTIRRHIY
jgi:hypothetical protein